VFAYATFNFGPNTCCFDHVNYRNLPFDWCAITALGMFNPTLGGHLVLWDLKIVIEFPPGSTILISSGAIRHSNIAIRQSETRYSFTQYTAEDYSIGLTMATRQRHHTSRGGAGIGKNLRRMLISRGGLRAYRCSQLWMSLKACLYCSTIIFC
jgi:hypothetical protein